MAARRARAGQFVIIIPDEKGERIPLTIADYDRARGTVTVIFQVVGASTLKLQHMKAGGQRLCVRRAARPSHAHGRA